MTYCRSHLPPDQCEAMAHRAPGALRNNAGMNLSDFVFAKLFHHKLVYRTRCEGQTGIKPRATAEPGLAVWLRHWM